MVATAVLENRKSKIEKLLSLACRHKLVLGLLLIFVACSIHYSTSKVLDPSGKRSAFLRWREIVLDLGDGINVYDSLHYQYPNPPIMGLILYPLALLPPVVGALAWFYLKVGMALAALYWAFRLVENPNQPFPLWARVVTVLLTLRPILGDLTHGNVNLFILFLVMAGLYAFRHSREAMGGGMIGLAVACKVTPALFLPYFVWKRSWKAVAGGIGGLVFFLFVVPGGILGWSHNADLLQSWYAKMVKPYVVDGLVVSADGTVVSAHPNQSLPGICYRLLSENPAFEKLRAGENEASRFHNLASLSHSGVRWLLKSCTVLFVLAVLWTCRTPTPWTMSRGQRKAGTCPNPANTAPGTLLSAEFSMIMLGMLLFSERTWKHHCVLLVLPVAVLCYLIATGHMSKGLRVYLASTLVLVGLLMSSTSTGLLMPWENLAKMAEVYGAYVWANLLLLIALIIVLCRSETISIAGQSSTGNHAGQSADRLAAAA